MPPHLAVVPGQGNELAVVKTPQAKEAPSPGIPLIERTFASLVVHHLSFVAVRPYRALARQRPCEGEKLRSHLVAGLDGCLQGNGVDRVMAPAHQNA
jgi:hypothetical protein